MSIFLAETDRVIVQGMIDSEGRKHTIRMLSAGTKVVAGVSPRKADTTVAFGVTPIGPGAGEVQAGTIEVPVCGTIVEAKEATGAEMSVVFVPPAFTKGAVVEAVDAGVHLLIVTAEDIPVADAVWIRAYAAEHGVQIIGPNYPGIISPARSNVSITPSDITDPGPLGLVSKSGTLTYQLMHELSDLGFTTCIGIGEDPVVGTTHIDALAAFGADPDTRLIVMTGEVGGDAEKWAAIYIREHMTKSVVAYIAGLTIPEGHTMGYAGAIVSGSSGVTEAKRIALGAAGIRVGHAPSQIAEVVRGLYRQLTGEVNA